MTKHLTLADLPRRHQAEVAAQLLGVRHPRTVAIEVVRDLAPARPVKLARKRPIDASGAFIAAGLPAPTLEHRFHDTRKWRFDYSWPAQRIALEVEGGVWTGGRHTRGSGFLKDCEKYNAAACAGWRVVRCTPSTLKSAATIAMLRILLCP